MDECVLCEAEFDGVDDLEYPVCERCASRAALAYRTARSGDWFRWEAEIFVHKTWVEDGFNLTDERLTEIMMRALPHATGNEVKCQVLSAPDPKSIRAAQGYKENAK